MSEPIKPSTILGHDRIRQRFSSAMQQGKLHHAWLLYGVQGIGKASLALSLRDLYLCESPDLEQGKACGQCHVCAMNQAQSHPDFKAIHQLWDEKTKKYKRDINIAQTREALSFLALSGLKSPKRVLLIDDANLMNNQAANALLKGLEEPAAESLLLIVCHDLQRLPATIRSRCMLQACAPLSEEHMRTLLTQQGMDEALLALALSLGQGSLGRIAPLFEAEQARVLLQWQTILADLARSDVGLIQQWLDKYVKILPHDLIATMVVQAAEKHALESASWQQADVVYQAILAVAAWPKEVVRHSLRPAPAMLANILQLRLALKS